MGHHFLIFAKFKINLYLGFRAQKFKVAMIHTIEEQVDVSFNTQPKVACHPAIQTLYDNKNGVPRTVFEIYSVSA